MFIRKFTPAFIFLAAFAAIIAASSACQRASSKTAETDAKRYELDGKVISVDKQARKANIEHDEIKGYMPAMTMAFPIKDDWVIRELEPNDKISADLVVTKDAAYYIENVKIVKASRDANGNVSAVPEAGANLIGVEVPDFKLTNQNGKRFGLHDYRGKTLVITFIFTRCPDANMCPLMSINFSDLEKQLQQSPELAAKTRLLSITFDPEYDTPEVLRKYAAAYQGKDVKPNFDIWNLATGTVQEVKDVEGFLGANSFKADDNRIVHNLRTVIVAPNGRIAKVYSGNGWKPADILRDLQTLQ
ncbi:MAG: SCO family protein [Pyrinomonadaceae bacterium]